MGFVCLGKRCQLEELLKSMGHKNVKVDSDGKVIGLDHELTGWERTQIKHMDHTLLGKLQDKRGVNL